MSSSILVAQAVISFLLVAVTCDGAYINVETKKAVACGTWGAWYESPCCSSCGGGKMTRVRYCGSFGLAPSPPRCYSGCSYGDNQEEIAQCNTQDCPNDEDNNEECNDDTNNEETETCLDGDYYEHPTKCEQFYRCADGIKELNTCPTGLLWNNDIRKCDFPSNVECKKNGNSDGDTNNEETGIYQHGEYFKHPTKCNQFYQCDRGTKVLKTCPDGTLWNNDIVACDHAINVECKNNDNSECACNVADLKTAKMCNSNEKINCNACRFGQRYAHDVNNCQYFYECVFDSDDSGRHYTILKQRENPENQYWSAVDGRFKEKEAGCKGNAIEEL